MDKLQIQIKLEKDEDSKAVGKILGAAAEKFRLIDNTVTSLVLNTIQSLIEEMGLVSD
jgi:hypothetical protein